jgi:hypothetical protein
MSKIPNVKVMYSFFNKMTYIIKQKNCFIGGYSVS